MVQNILLIGNKPELLSDIVQGLHKFNHVKAFFANTSRQALDHVSRFSYTLVIMDFDGLNFGIEFIKKLRTLHSGTMLILSIRATEHEEIQVLDAGADQYLEIGTPLSTKRCIANVSAIIRRNLAYRSNESEIILNARTNLKINRCLRKVYAHGKDLRLTPKQFALLSSLVEHIGEVVTKEQLYQEVWGNEYDISADSALKYHIKELRRKLGEHGNKDMIETAWGVGYLLQLFPCE